MTFFEPLPPDADPREPQPTGWAPPVWDRPSEAMLGAPVSMSALIVRTARLALAVNAVMAHPNGFTFALVYIGNPLEPRPPGGHGMLHPGVAGPGRGPRIGLEFADGTRTVDHSFRIVDGRVHRPEVPKDEDGVPTVPVLQPCGGGGGSHQFAMRYWCFPLPPPGPMDLHLEWAHMEIPETKVTLDGDAVRVAAERAVTIWAYEPGDA